MIRPATPADRPALMALWQDCFGDGEDYLTAYFKNHFRPQETLVGEEDGGEAGTLASMVTLLPLTLRSPDGGAWRGRYVYAVGTASSHRRHGWSSRILAAADAQTRERGEDFLLLVPAQAHLIPFYEKRGYRVAFHQHQECFDFPHGFPQGLPPLTPGSLPPCRPLRDAAFGAAALYGAWDGGMLAQIEAEVRFFGGGVHTFPPAAPDSSSNPGYAVAVPAEDTLLIKELLPAGHPPELLAAALCRAYGLKKARLRCGPAAPGQLGEWPYAMLRWLGGTPPPLTGAIAPYFALGLD